MPVGCTRSARIFLHSQVDSGIFPNGRKIVPRNSEPVPIFAVSEEAKTGEGRPVWIAKVIALAPWLEAPVLVSTTASATEEVSPVQGYEEHSNNMTAFGIMNVFPNRYFKIVVANTGSIVVTLAKRQLVAVAKAPQLCSFIIKR